MATTLQLMAAPIPTWPFTVEPAWIDYNGHMNMGFYVVAFDVKGTDEFFDWLGVGEEYIAEYNMSLFTLSSSTDYLGELFEGDTGSISTRMLDWDHKRIHYLHEMADAEGQVVATNELLSMNVDLETRRSVAFPEHVQRRLAELMEVHHKLPPHPSAGRVIAIRR